MQKKYFLLILLLLIISGCRRINILKIDEIKSLAKETEKLNLIVYGVNFHPNNFYSGIYIESLLNENYYDFKVIVKNKDVIYDFIEILEKEVFKKSKLKKDNDNVFLYSRCDLFIKNELVLSLGIGEKKNYIFLNGDFYEIQDDKIIIRLITQLLPSKWRFFQSSY